MNEAGVILLVNDHRRLVRCQRTQLRLQPRRQRLRREEVAVAQEARARRLRFDAASAARVVPLPVDQEQVAVDAAPRDREALRAHHGHLRLRHLARAVCRRRAPLALEGEGERADVAHVGARDGRWCGAAPERHACVAARRRRRRAGSWVLRRVPCTTVVVARRLRPVAHKSQHHWCEYARNSEIQDKPNNFPWPV
eukprot:6113191-Prymnesium_polylepis.2